MKRFLIALSFCFISHILWAGSITISAPTPYTAPILTSGTVVPSIYGIGRDGSTPILLSSGVPACQEWVTPTTINISTASFAQATNFSSHTAIGFYDANCNLLAQSTVTLSGSGTNTIFFNSPFSMLGGTKYFICMSVDANNVTIAGAVGDQTNWAALVNAGVPATNYHVFKAGNLSTVGPGPVVLMPSACGIRSNYSSVESTIGYALY